MENLVLLVVGIMIIPAVIGGLIFAVNDRDTSPYPVFESRKQQCRIAMWPDDYVRLYYNGIYDTVKSTELAQIFGKLRKIDRGKPKDRKANKYDIWYDANIKNFCKHGEVLAYIAIYGNLTDRFMAGLENPQYNEELQKHLVSVYQNRYDNSYHLNCQNLLWYYLKRWDLLPQIKRVIMTDNRFAPALKMYKTVRGEIHPQ